MLGFLRLHPERCTTQTSPLAAATAMVPPLPLPSHVHKTGPSTPCAHPHNAKRLDAAVKGIIYPPSFPLHLVLCLLSEVVSSSGNVYLLVSPSYNSHSQKCKA